MTQNLAQTPLHGWHAAHGGRMVEFGGWSLPVQYQGIVAEHQATRSAVGLFDISHMGRLHFIGPAAPAFLNSIVTKDVTKIGPGRIRYALVTNEDGNVLDDVLVYHLKNAEGGSYHVVVVNASNRGKIIDWLSSHLAEFADKSDVDWFDLTGEWAMIAVQGPKAFEILQPLVELDLAGMKYYTGKEASIAGYGGVVSRTGYTGEDGYEIMVGSPAAPDIWEQLIAAAEPLGGMAAGLGCRDTLRLEAAMPLYGHELTEETNPYQAGLSFAVDLDKPAYPGQDVLRLAKDDSTLPVRVGLELAGKRIAREEFPIMADGRQVGFVTSGTFAPTLQKALAMGYVERQCSAKGQELSIEIRGKAEPARVVPLPFYKRPK